jgi:DNA-binding XRE family transcriptional regulator
MFRGMTRVTLSQAAGVSPTGLSSIERGLNSGSQVRDKLALALAVPADALIAHF